MGEQVLAALQLAPATVAGILYALRVHTLRGTTRAVPAWRQACFFGGLLVQVAGIVALGGLADELFWAHMTEHLLLGDVGALLLVLGLTGPVLAPVLRLPGLRHLAALAHPVVAVGLWALNLAFWHLPAVQDAAVRHEGLHALQHTAFVGCGVLMWLALLGPAAQARVVRQRRAAGLRARRPAHGRRPRERPRLRGPAVLRRLRRG